MNCHKCGDEVKYVIGCGYSATYECQFCGFMVMLAHHKLNQSGDEWDEPSMRFRFYNHCCMMCDNITPKGETMCSTKCREKWDKEWEDLGKI